MTKGHDHTGHAEIATGTSKTCPDHGHRLIPIHRVSGGHRVVVGWTCPEPYCDHAEVDPGLTDDPASHDFDDAR